MGFPLYVTCFSLASFNILFLYLISVSLINVSQCVSPWVHPVGDSLCFLDLIISHVGEVFNYNFFKNFLSAFLFFFFLWDPYNSNIGTFNIVPKVSEAFLNSFHSFPFILLFSSYFHRSILQLTYLFLCLNYSAIGSL